jgi:hypothetical protein
MPVDAKKNIKIVQSWIPRTEIRSKYRYDMILRDPEEGQAIASHTIANTRTWNFSFTRHEMVAPIYFFCRMVCYWLKP